MLKRDARKPPRTTQEQMLQCRAAAAAQREKDRFERLLRAQQRDEAAAREREVEEALVQAGGPGASLPSRFRRSVGRSFRGFHRTAEALRASYKAAGLDIALRSALFRKLTAIVVITGFAGGIGVLTIQFLQMRITFRAREQAIYLQIYGVMGLLVRRGSCAKPRVSRFPTCGILHATRCNGSCLSKISPPVRRSCKRSSCSLC